MQRFCFQVHQPQRFPLEQDPRLALVSGCRHGGSTPAKSNLWGYQVPFAALCEEHLRQHTREGLWSGAVPMVGAVVTGPGP